MPRDGLSDECADEEQEQEEQEEQEEG